VEKWKVVRVLLKVGRFCANSWDFRHPAQGPCGAERTQRRKMAAGINTNNFIVFFQL